MKEFIDISLEMAHGLKPTIVLIFADNLHFLRDCRDRLLKTDGYRFLIVTRDTNRNREELIESNGRLEYYFINQPVLAEMGVLTQLNDLMIELCITGKIRTDDRVMCIVYGELFTTMYFRPGDISVIRMMGELKERINVKVLQRVIELGAEIAREGKVSKRR